MKKRLFLSCALMAMIGFSQQAFASGFFLIEQSVSSMGNAYAGAAAAAQDASTIFFNPAGMSKLKYEETVSGVHIVIPHAKFKDNGSKVATGLGDAELTGGDGGEAGEGAAIGHFYYVTPLSCDLTFGLGINSPFGLVTAYDKDWKGRYHGIRSQLFTLLVNPSLAYKFNDCLSFGAGIDVMYAKAELTNAVDSGAYQEGQSQQLDGRAKVQGESWGLGYNLGILWDYDCNTRFGLAFRSEMKHTVKGILTLGLPAEVLKASLEDSLENLNGIINKGQSTILPAFDNRAKSNVTFPSILSLSAVHQLNSCLDLLADISWTKWDVLKELRFTFNGDRKDEVTTLGWKNSMRYSLGANYYPWECWTLRAGVAYDESPIPSKKLRTVRIPGEDRLWLAVGAGYNYLDCLVLDFGYAHLFVTDPKVSYKEPSDQTDENFTKGVLKGKYDAHTDIISAQLRYIF